MVFIGSSIVDGTIQFMSDMTSAHRCVDSRKQAVPLVYSTERCGGKMVRGKGDLAPPPACAIASEYRQGTN
jgi:hypothetical protein